MLILALITLVAGLSQEECISQLLEFNYSKACISLLFSKALGYGIVAASLMLKVPQIYKIIEKGSVEGISITAFYIETLSFTMNAAYGLHKKMPISTYGEQITVSVQCIVQVGLYWLYGRQSLAHKFIVLTAFHIFWILPLFAELHPSLSLFVLPDAFWSYMQIYNIIMLLFTKSTQIKENYSNGSTGNLSFITSLLNLVGCVTRIFTTMTELNDPALLANYLIGTLLNLTIVLQFWKYWNVKQKTT